ncbi:hypothetical protein E2I00_020172 [Balaenoptera physalus]|uniref:Uncharacterized protein n=1 Tax=Balaenoptera physalus TaxID=9770 RepID=A0A643C975_BALPH|nr:hypothetical protein E2I00_020172 [Balaenoptera physalus]
MSYVVLPCTLPVESVIAVVQRLSCLREFITSGLEVTLAVYLDDGIVSLEPLPASGPDFGALGEEAEFVEVEPEAKQEILENKDVMRRSHEAREKLLRLGIFRQVDVLIDTCQGDNALPNGLDVTFEVTELRRLTGSYNTMVGNNEGSMFPIWKTSHTVKWEGVWRELGCLARTVSFAVRKESGHSLKSSLSELAGYTGGDVSFIKEDFELQLNKQLILDSVLPRGTHKCARVQHAQRWATERRAHIRKLAECIRWSYGAGIVLRLGNIARLELNYCVPMGVQGGDRVGSDTPNQAMLNVRRQEKTLVLDLSPERGPE